VDDESLNYQRINYEPCVDEGFPSDRNDFVGSSVTKNRFGAVKYQSVFRQGPSKIGAPPRLGLGSVKKNGF